MKLLLTLFLTSLISHAAEIKEEKVTHAGSNFRIVRIDPNDLRAVWKNEAGEIYHTFDKVQTAIAAKGKTVRFLMNAGIYEPGGIPSGIHIEDNKELLPLNPKDGRGNFFLKPNGIVSVWMGRNGGARISTIDDWNLQREHGRKVRDLQAPSLAVQSGPLLLINGKRHPAFREGSDSRLHRNGIGIDDKGQFVCAITAPGEMVNFWDFAGLFLKLGCRNALYLDGTISQMAVNPAKPGLSNVFAARFVVAD